MEIQQDSKKVKQFYEKELRVNKGSLEESDTDLHDYIIRGLSNLGESEFSYIFGIRNPSRILSEGEKIRDNIVVEDFAITGSYNSGEIAIGQVVSANGKESISSVPKDYLQVNSFGDRIESEPGIDPEITGYYIVRAGPDPEEVVKKTQVIDRDLGFYGRVDIAVDIYRVDPDEREIEETIENFYSSLAQS